MSSDGRRSMKNLAPPGLPPELQQALTALIGTLIPGLMMLLALWYLEVSSYLWALAAVLLVLLALFVTFSAWRHAMFQFRSLHNLLEAMVKGNYTMRGARGEGGSYDTVVSVINELADTLHRQRLQSEEKQVLLLKVISQIDVAVLAWDEDLRIQLINPAAAELFGVNTAISEKAPLPASIEFATTMQTGQAQLRDLEFATTRGRYVLFKERFVADGNTQHLLFMTNISGILRAEEKKAWQNLIRVLSHEINNSLAPLQSLSQTLARQVELREQDNALAGELNKGLMIIGKRAAALTNFLHHYKTLASLPEPMLAAVDLKQLVTGVCDLFADLRIRITGLPIVVRLDAGQMEQVLINLLKNAAEAKETGENSDTAIEISWFCSDQKITVLIGDSGRGIASQQNLFMPFYTTKNEGSGIGLSLCRQIIEAHGGEIFLENRKDQLGCIVSITLPMPDGSDKHL